MASPRRRRAIEQQQQSGIARLQPGLGLGAFRLLDDLQRRRLAQGLGQRLLALWCADQAGGGRDAMALALQAAEKTAYRAQAARQRGGFQAIHAAAIEIGAEIRRAQAA